MCDFAEQEKRISGILGEEEVPEVTDDTLKNLILENRGLSFMFGFSATNRDEEITKAINSFIGKN